MPIPLKVVKCFKYVDSQQKNYIEELKDIIKIPTISSNRNHKKNLVTIIDWVYNRLRQLNFQVKLIEPHYKKYKGNKPFVILGSLNSHPSKKTLLYYCHLDVLKVQKEQWKTDPFELTQLDGKLFGRGTAKMKGPLLCFLHAVESYKKLGIEMPINIKIVCESMNECRSVGLISILDELKASFFQDVSCVLMTDSHWLGTQYPCLIYGTRGVCYFNVVIKGPTSNLHSGNFGGLIREPMQDVIYILNSLVDSNDSIKIPNFYDDVVEVTPDEEITYEKIKYSINDLKRDTGVDKFGRAENIKSILMHVWRFPWINLHYINNSCDKSNVLDIPGEVSFRFSLRTVPNQTHQKVIKLVIDFVNKIVEEINTPNKIVITNEKNMDPWYENNLHWNYLAASKAIKQVYKEDVSYIREGNGFPILLKLHEALPNRNILILPLVSSESKIHSEDENISLRCYIEGTKLLASYFYELNVNNESLDNNLNSYKTCRNRK